MYFNFYTACPKICVCTRVSVSVTSIFAETKVQYSIIVIVITSVGHGLGDCFNMLYYFYRAQVFVNT